jgi:flavin-dependent dehydrogenase
MSRYFDVAICGGGLAGLTIARQLSQELPQIRIAVLDKTRRPLPEGTHKVGESTVELGALYWERLGLRAYLHERHLIKFGLRFFPGGGERPIEARTEIGPINQPVVRSYQIDRGRFESDLRAMLDDTPGVELLEGVTVRDVGLEPGAAPHRLEVDREDERLTLSARWVVDATGRAALLRSRMKTKRGGNHDANAAWFRVRGRIDINEMAPASARRFLDVPESSDRWLSTNHLMGRGYWVWIIPLPSGMTSVGIVTHEHVHDFDAIRTLDRARSFLEAHEPTFAAFLEDREILDFSCLRKYCHTVARSWHPDRWALVGEAGAFPDPLYSPGTDYIAIANGFTADLIRRDLDGATSEALLARSQELNALYRSLVNGAIALYRDAADVYGHARAMAAKVYWDDHIYWSYPCQFMLQGIYRLSGPELEPFNRVGARFFELSSRMQKVFRFWAEHLPSEDPPEGELFVVPTFPSMLVDGHLALQRKMTVPETLEYMEGQLELAEQLFNELVLRVLEELGPELGQRMWSEIGADAWGIGPSPTRTAAEALSGRARRRALPHVARDAERTLGPPRVRWPVADIAAFLAAGARESAVPAG